MRTQLLSAQGSAQGALGLGLSPDMVGNLAGRLSILLCQEWVPVEARDISARYPTQPGPGHGAGGYMTFCGVGGALSTVQGMNQTYHRFAAPSHPMLQGWAHSSNVTLNTASMMRLPRGQDSVEIKPASEHGPFCPGKALLGP